MYIKEINIGNVKIKNNIFLAPMAGITDKAFRKICIEQGVGLTYSEMISSKGIYYKDKKTLELMKKNDEEIPYAVQIFGDDVYIISEAIKAIENKADIIDINMGCPAPKVVNNNEGSALLKDIDLVYEIVRKAVESTNIPITVKIRKGWDNDSINAVEVAKVVEQAGAKAITIHGRTRNDFFSGECDLDIIKKVKENVNIPVIGNGDIIDFETAMNMFYKTNVDGIMIGRGTLGNPWIFKYILDRNINNKIIEVSNEEKREVIFKHYDYEIANKGEYTAIREMRKHISWYVKGMKDSAEFRNEINRLENVDEIFNLIDNYLKRIAM